MKSYRNLYPDIVSFDNLYYAWCKARRGKRYKPGAASFEDVPLQDAPLCVPTTANRRDIQRDVYP